MSDLVKISISYVKELKKSVKRIGANAIQTKQQHQIVNPHHQLRYMLPGGFAGSSQTAAANATTVMTTRPVLKRSLTINPTSGVGGVGQFGVPRNGGRRLNSFGTENRLDEAAETIRSR